MATGDQIRICSEALVLLGEEPIDSLEGDSTPQLVAARLYQPTANDLLASHPWRFNRRVEALNRIEAAPPVAVGFDAAYALPAGCLRIIAPFIGGTAARAWEPAETVIWLDAGVNDRVELEYHAAVDEQRWTPAFRQGVVYRLAAEMAVPIRDDPKARDLYLRDADRKLALARHQNATERPARRLIGGRFEALRRR